MRVTMTCTECSEKMIVTADQCEVKEIGFEHADDCRFLAAVERGRGREWVAEHGYPMAFIPMKEPA